MEDFWVKFRGNELDKMLWFKSLMKIQRVRISLREWRSLSDGKESDGSEIVSWNSFVVFMSSEKDRKQKTMWKCIIHYATI